MICAMSEIIFLVEMDPGVGYTARALGSSVFTEAEDWDALVENIREAVSCHFGDDPGAPKVVRLHFVRDEVFAL
jgi:hypothetical protein